MIVIVDYKTGNIGSIKNMIKKLGFSAEISSDIKIISNAEKLILPGVGAFGNAVKKIQNLGLWDILNEKAIVQKIPILGICLGAQLMTKRSEEDKLVNGFGWVNGETIRFNFNEKNNPPKIPNMGWLEVNRLGNDKIYEGIDEAQRFYFLHSYHFRFDEKSPINGIANYGYNFPVSFVDNNIIGVQFHPEKSHMYGMNLIKNFITNY